VGPAKTLAADIVERGGHQPFNLQASFIPSAFLSCENQLTVLLKPFASVLSHSWSPSRALTSFIV